VRRLTLLAATLTLAALAVGVISRSPTAQTGPEVYEACRPDRVTIPAPDVPETVEMENCPIGERVITDHGVGTVLPDAGEGVYAEALTPTGAQELEVTHHRDGTVELEHVGNDSGDETTSARASSRELSARGSPGECADRAFNKVGYRVGKEGLPYRFKLSSTPRNLARAAAVKAISRGGTNMIVAYNSCHLGYRVPATLRYEGRTSLSADVTKDGRCVGNDGVNVVSFGDLPRALAVTCTFFVNGTVISSDLQINKADYRWTTKPGSRSCKRMWDLMSVVTHERGHTLGLGHVPEASHPNLTMSPMINGACQSSERTLGRGDVRGLEATYSK
jgi:Matrixin